jgi:hypothetical protein
MGTRNLHWGKKRPAHRAHNLDAILSRMSVNCASLKLSQPQGPPRPVQGELTIPAVMWRNFGLSRETTQPQPDSQPSRMWCRSAVTGPHPVFFAAWLRDSTEIQNSGSERVQCFGDPVPWSTWSPALTPSDFTLWGSVCPARRTTSRC